MPSTPEAVTLNEHQEVKDVPLASAQARALARFRFPASDDGNGSLSIVNVSPGSVSGKFNVSANSIVGSVSIAGMQLNILPKAGVGRTAQMLAYSLGLAKFVREPASFTDVQSFSELLVPSFLTRTSEVVREGVAEDYVDTVEIGWRPRGQIQFDRLARTGLPAPAQFTYDDFTYDTPFNQLLLRALHAARELGMVAPGLHDEVRLLLGAFDDVTFVDWPSLYRGANLPDRTAYYRDAMILATLILEGTGIDAARSSRVAHGLLFDMNRVFEDFMCALVRESAPAGCTVDLQGAAHPIYFDVERRLRLRPDFTVWDRFGCVIVGDVKYKVLSAERGPRRPDLYQMASYAAASGASRALLIYVGTNPGTDIDVSSPRMRIEVRAVDINQPIDAVQQQVRALIDA